MVKKYIIVRMPIRTYNIYKNVQDNMKKDLSRIENKPLEKIKLPMTKVFHAVVSPRYNENFIQVDLRKLSSLRKSKKWRLR